LCCPSLFDSSTCIVTEEFVEGCALVRQKLRCGMSLKSVQPVRLALRSGIIALLLAAGCRNAPQPAVSSQSQPDKPSQAARSAQPESAQAYGQERSGRRRSKRGHAEQVGTPGVFDFYLLNLSWSPEFCATHGNSTECGHGLGFVVHGLWPQDFSGDYPEDCSDAPGPADPQQYTDLIPTVGLIQHEWETHGTCSGMASDAYFAAIRKADTAVRIPADIGTGEDASGVTPQKLLGRFAKSNPGYPQGSFALSCGNNQLTAIEICLGKDLQPEICQGVRSCRANSIRVTPK
jgi:ribonuclease T2